MRSVVRLLLIALAAAVIATTVGIVAYVLLLPTFIQRTPRGVLEPGWLLPVTASAALVLSGFFAQRVLATQHERRFLASAALGISIGVFQNLGWSVRLLMTDATLVEVFQAWSIMLPACALAGSLFDHALSK